MRPEVAFASGDVPGITRMTSGAEAKGVTFVTSATWKPVFQRLKRGHIGWATGLGDQEERAVEAGPKPSASRS